MKKLLLILAILLAAAAPGRAQQDEAGCKDPMFARMPSFIISGCESEASDSYDFEKRDGTITVQGQYSKTDYWVRETVQEPEAVRILEFYWKAAAAKGGTKVLERLDAHGGILTAKIPGQKGSGTIWLEVYVTMKGEAYSVVVVQEKAPQ